MITITDKLIDSMENITGKARTVMNIVRSKLKIAVRIQTKHNHAIRVRSGMKIFRKLKTEASGAIDTANNITAGIVPKMVRRNAKIKLSNIPARSMQGAEIKKDRANPAQER